MKTICFLLFLLPALALSQGLERSRFYQIIDEVTGLYHEELHAREGTFFIEKDWESQEINAEALSIYSREGQSWGLHFHGGLARHELMSEASFALIVCHEIGHFLGGRPYKRGFRGEVSWSTAEGQADTFAAGKCFKRYLKDLRPNLQQADLPSNFSGQVQRLCQGASSPQSCEFTHKAAFQMASFFRQRRIDQDFPTGPELSFNFQDLPQVNATLSSHPTPLCRIATISAATLCEKDDLDAGYCQRPRCWYHPDFP